MDRRITAAALVLVAACGGRLLVFGGSRAALNYAQFKSLAVGMEAKELMKDFGPAEHVLRREEKVRGLTYPCENASGEIVELRLAFSAEERLERWVMLDPKSPKTQEGKPSPEEAPAPPENPTPGAS